MESQPNDGTDDDGSDDYCCLFPDPSLCWSGDRNSKKRRKTASAELSEADELLAKELNELSVNQRDFVLDEIHGVADTITESPSFVSQSLAMFEKEIAKVRKQSMYNRALFLAPRHVKDKKLRLMFLRAEYFDAANAAQRMIRYFEKKRELWGDSKLGKTITLDDFDEDDIACLKTGSLQYSDASDRAGRPIIFLFQKYANYDRWQKSLLRVLWYQMMALLEDENTQRNGMVIVIFDREFGKRPAKYSEGVKDSYSVGDSLPYRAVAVHYCYDSPSLRPSLTIFQLLARRNLRMRFRAHFGSQLECEYALLTFGILPENALIDARGEVKAEKVLQHIEKRKEMESQMIHTGIYCPSDNDVLLGRGKPFQEWPGNIHLSTIINRHRKPHDESDRAQKTAISRDVVQMIKGLSGRFLQLDKETEDWEEVSDAVAREKVGAGFRRRTKGSQSSSGYDEDRGDGPD